MSPTDAAGMSSSVFNLVHYDIQLSEGGTDRAFVGLSNARSLLTSNEVRSDVRVAIQDDVPNCLPRICSLKSHDLLQDRDGGG